MDFLTLGIAKKYVADTMEGAGAIKGDRGKSAYEVAQDNGFEGTENEWLISLQGGSMADIKEFCKSYIDSELLGGAS